MPERTLSLNYLTYEWLPPDLSLFGRPANVTFEESTPP